MTVECARCVELEDELRRVKAIAGAAGAYNAPSEGPNPRYNGDREAGRWLAAHPHATPEQAWRGGWNRARSITRGLLAEHRRRAEANATLIASLRSKIGVLIMEAGARNERG